MAKKQNIILAVGIIAAILIGLSIGIGAYYLGGGNNNPQPGSQDTYVPTLTANLQCSDNRSSTDAPFLQITGTIQNTGNATANNVKMHVFASQSGNHTAIDTTITLASIEAGETQTVNEAVGYTGDALELFSEPTIDWTS
jgi:hypothetical protein